MFNHITNRKVIIFGTGELSRKMIQQYSEVLESLNIVGVIDNNPLKAEEVFFGNKIGNPDSLKNYRKDNIFILVASSFYVEISNQLRELGFKEGEHYEQAMRVLGSLMYQGDRVFCACCEHHFQEFMPYGNPARRNAQCPYCLSLERHRLIWLYLTKYWVGEIKHSIRLLHVAPEPVIHQLVNQISNTQYISIDLDPNRAMFAMDLTALTFEENYFDTIICSHVLEHINDDRMAMKELYRVLKPEGFAILQVPIDKTRKNTYENWDVTTPEGRMEYFGHPEHVRCYGLDYHERLTESGFRVLTMHASELVGKDQLERYGLNNEDLYICSK